MKMNPRIKKIWLEALRSGEYKQGHSQLCKVEFNPDGSYHKEFCCLGVLGDLYRKEQKKSGHFLDEALPPLRVLKWAGIDKSFWNDYKEDIGSFDVSIPKYSGEEKTLAGMNDNGMSFKQIANVIEKYL